MNLAHTPKLIKREKCNIPNENLDSVKEPVRVFCRIRPLKDGDPACISLVSPTELSLNTPSDPKYGSHKELHCQFKQIFSPHATQKEIFEFVALPLLQDLLQGKNALLLSYGVTGSGKTFTLFGEQSNPGIIIRCINTIFSSIQECQTPKFKIKSDKMNYFEIQSERDAVRDQLTELKANVRSIKDKFNRRDCGASLNYRNEGTRLIDVDISKFMYAVFVTYVEIYNNSVYDLLDDSNGKISQAKILREDAHKNMYVNGVVELEVKSAEEVFELMNKGQRKKRMGHTVLNSESSRSHSVFTIRLVEVERSLYNKNHNISDSSNLRVSQISLVDLAGSERTNRTKNTGIRLREASKINNSLMTLRNCLEILRENQLTGSNKLIPYRDSRLTLLFKNVFEGYGKVEMIVCVNPSIENYDENIQVMKFAEMSQEITIKSYENKRTPYIKNTTRNLISTPSSSSKTKVRSRSPFLLSRLPDFSFDREHPDEIGPQIDQLAYALKARHSIVESVFCDYTNSERDFKKRLCKFSEGSVPNTSGKNSLNILIKKRKLESYNLENKIVKLEKENDNLYLKNHELKKILISKSKIKGQLATSNKEVEEHQLTKLQNISKNGKIVSTSPHEPQELLSPTAEESQTNKRTKRCSSARQRRSRSAGEVWLEHNSVKPIPLDTVLQPSMKKRKSLTKLTTSDITNPNQSKYCLIAQEHDMEGDLETKVYKGDIVPTCGGGVQVIFNDVELLKQRSPIATP